MNRENFAPYDAGFEVSEECSRLAGTSNKKSKTKKKPSVPPALDPVPSPGSSVPPMASQGGSGANLPPANGPITEGFALPGDTASSDEWEKAFTLAPSSTALAGFSGGFLGSVDGAPSSWRKIPSPVPSTSSLVTSNNLLPPISPSSLSNIPYDIQRRIDLLAQQLEGITGSTPMQNTAEIFLFIAIGLLFILAVDTLLRFTTQIALRSFSLKKMKWSGGGRRFH